MAACIPKLFASVHLMTFTDDVTLHKETKAVREKTSLAKSLRRAWL